METTKLEIREEKIMDRIDLFDSLFEEHWDEIAKNKKVMVLKPDYNRYKQLEQSGSMRTLVAYENDKIVGYSVNFVMPHIHYSELVTCFNDIVFVTKDRRSSILGLKLIKETEKAAAKWGAGMMLWHVKENSSISKILPRKGYSVQDIIYSKVLE